MTFAGRTVPPLSWPGSPRRPRPPPHVSSPRPSPRELNTQGPGTSLGHTASCPLASANRQRPNTGGPGIKSDPQRDRRVVSIPIGFETTAISCPRLPSKPRLPDPQGKGPTLLPTVSLPPPSPRQARRPPSAHFSTSLCTHVSPCMCVSVAAHTFVPIYMCLSVPVCLPGALTCHVCAF